ncbi:MAG: HupE/UreJ family protein [Steroidobacteraceae bacterium]
MILWRTLWLIMLMCAHQASAHPAPFSYLDLYLESGSARGALVLHDYDVAHELGLAQPELLLDAGVAGSYQTRIVQLLNARLHFIADKQAIEPIWQTAEILGERQSLRLPFNLQSRGIGELRIQTQLFPYDVTHQSFINIYESGRLKHQAILDAGHTSLSYYSGNVPGRWAVVRDFVQAGIQHILIGPDHILFLIGLLLLGGTLWRLVSIVTAFTLGHSITLSLAALGWVKFAPNVVEPLIALSIVVVGVDNLLVRRQARLGAMTEPRDLRPWLAAAFGLIHGFGFASVLLEFGLPRMALGWSLAAFNVGVELGQLAIVLPVTGALWILRRYSAAWIERCVLAGSILVSVAGAYWFVQRIWFGVS